MRRRPICGNWQSKCWDGSLESCTKEKGMIDTHSHIYVPEFSEDVDDVVARARQARIERIFMPNINMQSVEPMLDLCRRYPGYLYPMMGLHPEDVRDDWAQVLSEMEVLLQQPGHPFVAVGEVGLDFYWDKTYCEEQKMAFGVSLIILTALSFAKNNRSTMLREFNISGSSSEFISKDAKLTASEMLR